MCDFFDDDYEHGDDYDMADNFTLTGDNRDSTANCEHEIICDGHCEFCGIQINDKCGFVNDDISMDNGTKVKKTINNESLLNGAINLSIPIVAKDAIIKHIRMYPIHAKGSEDTTKKLLCVYGFKMCILTGMIECTPTRFFNICGIEPRKTKKIMTYIESLSNGKVLKCGTESYISPLIYIKEFLYVMWLKLVRGVHISANNTEPWLQDIEAIRNKDIVPVKYEVPPGHKDILLFAASLMEKNENKRASMRNKLYTLSNGQDLESNDEYYDNFIAGTEAREAARIERLNNRTIDASFKIEDYDDESDDEYHSYFMDTPQRAAAMILANVLLFSMKNINFVNDRDIILKRDAGEGNIEKRLYTLRDVVEYFSITETALNTLITKIGVRRMNNRTKSKNN